MKPTCYAGLYSNDINYEVRCLIVLNDLFNDFEFTIILTITLCGLLARCSVVVKALCYKPVGRGFDIR
jgi:hypothetical protein